MLVDLTAAPGRTVVFTRTKHGAKKLTKQLNASGVPAVELHGNLSQNARDRNMAAFSDGTAQTLVATDIAARGIHVDDVSLVIHADPPIEHKAYLHRSGRTARAGATGTVITLMTDDQVRDVRDLTRKAGISPTTTRLDAGHPLLRELAPGERTFSDPVVLAAPVQERPQSGRGSGPWLRSVAAPRAPTAAAPAAPVVPAAAVAARGWVSGGRQGAGREAAAGGGAGHAVRWSQALRYGAHRWPLRLDHRLHLDLGRRARRSPPAPARVRGAAAADRSTPSAPPVCDGRRRLPGPPGRRRRRPRPCVFGQRSGARPAPRSRRLAVDKAGRWRGRRPRPRRG